MCFALPKPGSGNEPQQRGIKRWFSSIAEWTGLLYFLAYLITAGGIGHLKKTGRRLVNPGPN